MNNFGIFIRSVGERTEELCYQSCLQGIAQSRIHLIKDLYPASRAYERMFKLAAQYRYTWYLGLDADVILRPNWSKFVAAVITQPHAMNYFVVSFLVQDPFLGIIDRGNHIYNGAFTAQALRVLRTTTATLLKPETAIHHAIAAPSPLLQQIIGWHGYEQYYRDIYYRFWLQYKRKPKLAWPKSQIDQSLEWQVVQAAWRQSKSEKFTNWLLKLGLRQLVPDQETRRQLNRQCHRLVNAERSDTMVSLSRFYKQYPLYELTQR